MADILQGLIFDLSLKTANLVKGVNESTSILNGFKEQINSVGKLIQGAFTVTAIVACTKKIAEFALQVGEANAQVRDLTGQSGEGLKNLTASILSTSQTFETDFNQTLQSTNALSRNLGISFEDASKIIQQSIALNDDKAGELLSTFQQYAPTIKELGISTKSLTGLITHIADSGQNVTGVFDSFVKAGKNLRDANQQTLKDLEAIGVNADALQLQVVNGSITEFDAIIKISEALQRFGNNSAEAGRVINDVFGKGANVIGVDFYKSLSKTNFGLEATLKNADAVESANLRIAAATEEINKVTVQLFGNTSTVYTQMKASILEVSANALNKLIKGTVDLINYFITLYNESLLFRAEVQNLVLPFKVLFDVVSYLFRYLVDGFTSAGQLIKAIVTGNFSAIPEIVKNGFQRTIDNYKTFGKDVFDSFKNSFESAVNNKPIELINLKDSNDQAENAGKQAAQNFAKGYAEEDYSDKIKTVKDKDIKIPLAKTATVKPLPDNFNATIKTSNQQLGYTYSLLEKVGMSFTDNIQNNAVNAINLLGNTIANNVGKGIASIRDFGNAFLTTAKQIIAAALSQSLAEAILSTSSIPFPLNIAAAGVAVGAISALFTSIPAFEQGGVVGSSNLIRMNEKGGELAFLPTGSVIVPHDLSARLVGGTSSNVQVRIFGKQRGQDIYYSQQETVRIRSNSI